MHRLFQTDDSWTQLALRGSLALVMFPHGAQKLLGWFGGYGWTGTMGFLTGQVGLPAFLAALVILIESLGAFALALGLGSRLMAAGLGVIMVGAVLTSHLSHGFFMNWGGTQAGEGFEYHLLALAIAAAVVLRGGGRWALDALIARRLAPSAVHGGAVTRLAA